MRTKLLRLWITGMAALLRPLLCALFRLRISGLEKLDFSRPAVLIPNHVSLLDALLLALYLPQEVAFVINTQMARRIRWVGYLRKLIPVDPLNPYAVRTMLKTVVKGTPLVVFPEGRVTTTGSMMKVYTGIGYIALKSQAQLFPVAIDGLERSRLSYMKGKLRQVGFPRTRIAIGTPFQVEKREGVSMRVQKEQATDVIRSRMTEHLLASRLPLQLNLYNELRDAAGRYGRSFVVCEDAVAQTKLTYKQLLLAACVLAERLAAELRGERRAAVLLPNTAAHVVTLFAMFRKGLTPALLNYSAGAQTMLDACETASATTIVTSRTFVDKAQLGDFIAAAAARNQRIVYLEDVRKQLAPADKLRGWLAYALRRGGPLEDNEVILFTSGSESKPKGVVLTHRSLYANVQQARLVIAFNQTDSLLGAMPMFHSFGLTAGTLLPLLSGMKVVLYPNPLHYKVIPELTYDRNITILFGTSTFLAAYGRTAHPYDFAHSLKYVVAGAERLKDEVRQLWMDKFGIRILEGYGTTETAPVISLNTPMYAKRGSVGRLLPGIAYKLEPVEGIAEGGSLLVKGPNVMKGYLLHGKGFEPCPEWYATGDIVRIDERGFLTIQGRAQAFAKIGGEKISLTVVEELAASVMPQALCAAVAVSDKRKGERIVLYHNAPAASLAAIKDAVRQAGHSPLYAPSALRYLDKLPLLGSGKIDYPALKSIAQRADEEE
ncbi:AMP-binding protein [Paenibacillus athensensis]|nr:AMP-binding protein [Paenibacillus athensensis]